MTKNKSSTELFANLMQSGTMAEVNPKPDQITSNNDADIEPDQELPEELGPDEVDQEAEMLQFYKDKCKLMSIYLSGDESLDDIRALIQNKLTGPEETEQELVSPLVQAQPSKTKGQNIRAQMKREQLKLVRLRITNLDPADKELPGAIYTVANEVLGAVRKYVPFGEATDNGYHVPYIIYKFLKGMVFTQYKTVKGQNGRQDTTQAREVRKFALEILPQLTDVEIKRLAAAQTAGGYNQE